jgi:hypothetical protein
MCTCDFDGHSEFYDVTYPRSRRERWCVECRDVIAPGTKYARHTQKWEGEVSNTTFCTTCDAWSKALITAQHAACGCSGWTFGCMAEALASFTDEHLGYHHETGEPLETEKQYRERQEAMRLKFRVWSDPPRHGGAGDLGSAST